MIPLNRREKNYNYDDHVSRIFTKIFPLLQHNRFSIQSNRRYPEFERWEIYTLTIISIITNAQGNHKEICNQKELISFALIVRICFILRRFPQIFILSRRRINSSRKSRVWCSKSVNPKYVGTNYFLRIYRNKNYAEIL